MVDNGGGPLGDERLVGDQEAGWIDGLAAVATRLSSSGGVTGRRTPGASPNRTTTPPLTRLRAGYGEEGEAGEVGERVATGWEEHVGWVVDGDGGGDCWGSAMAPTSVGGVSGPAESSDLSEASENEGETVPDAWWL